MIRKILLALGCLGIAVIVLMASGTFFVAREAKELVAAKVDEEQALNCKALRAEFRDAWDRAVDSGRFQDVEKQLGAMEREVDTKCGKM